MGLVIEFFEGYGYDVTIDAREDRRFGLTLRSGPYILAFKPVCNAEVLSGMHQVASRTDGLKLSWKGSRVRPWLRWLTDEYISAAWTAAGPGHSLPW